MYPAAENACRLLEQYIYNKIDSGLTVLSSKDVCIRKIIGHNSDIIIVLELCPKQSLENLNR